MCTAAKHMVVLDTSEAVIPYLWWQVTVVAVERFHHIAVVQGPKPFPLFSGTFHDLPDIIAVLFQENLLSIPPLQKIIIVHCLIFCPICLFFVRVKTLPLTVPRGIQKPNGRANGIIGGGGGWRGGKGVVGRLDATVLRQKHIALSMRPPQNRHEQTPPITVKVPSLASNSRCLPSNRLGNASGAANCYTLPFGGKLKDQAVLGDAT